MESAISPEHSAGEPVVANWLKLLDFCGAQTVPNCATLLTVCAFGTYSYSILKCQMSGGRFCWIANNFVMSLSRALSAYGTTIQNAELSPTCNSTSSSLDVSADLTAF
jgi:hypothetical protein